MPIRKVTSKIEFATLEEEINQAWEREHTFARSLAQRAGGREFVFYDGPPFATGLPHYGHLLAGTIKDVLPRYRTMRGYHVERRFGWDCHGLPVEYEMEKELQLGSRRDIEAYGVDRFNEACRGIKDTNPNGPQNFSYSTTGLTPINFTLDDDSDPTLPNTRIYSNIIPGTYTVTENPAAGFTLTNLVCNDPDNGTTLNLATRIATIDVDAGENITCVYTNTAN